MERRMHSAGRRPRKTTIALAAAMLLMPVFAGSAMARDNDRGDRQDHRQRDDHRDNRGNDRHDNRRDDHRNDRHDWDRGRDWGHGRDHDRGRHDDHDHKVKIKNVYKNKYVVRGHGDHHGHHGHHDRDRGGLSIRIGSYNHSHVCEFGHYETRTYSVLIAPERYERVWVDPVYETRYDGCGRSYTVLISPGGWQEVCVPAQYETRTTRYWVAGACDGGCSYRSSGTHISGGIRIRF